MSTSSITSVVQQWSDNPAANHGLVVEAGFPGLNDDLRIFTTGNSLPQARPKLSVTYTTDSVSIATFQSGVNGYSGVTSAVLTGPTTGGASESTANGVTQNTASLQQSASGSAERSRSSSSATSSVPAQTAAADKSVEKAWLVLMTTNSSSTRSTGPVDAYAMRRDWTTSTLRSQFGATAGLQFSDGDISGTYGRSAGMISDSEVWLDVTSYLEGVRSGTPDYGLAVLSRVTDGWVTAFNGAFGSCHAPAARRRVATQLRLRRRRLQ